MRDSLDPEVVEPLLRGGLGRPYAYRPVCESTQLELDTDLPEGACVAADMQTAGRGRLGRAWEAPAGTALLFSVLLRPPPDRPLPQLALVAGTATAAAVEHALGRRVGLKWPNDVVVDDRKLAGILAEFRGGAAIVGIGVNVNQGECELPPRAAFAATSLCALDGVIRPRAPLLAGLLAELERAYEAWRRGGLAAIAGELAERDCLRGREVIAATVHGLAAGIDAHGRLLIRHAGGTAAVSSGEVSFGGAGA